MRLCVRAEPARHLIAAPRPAPSGPFARRRSPESLTGNARGLHAGWRCGVQECRLRLHALPLQDEHDAHAGDHCADVPLQGELLVQWIFAQQDASPFGTAAKTGVAAIIVACGAVLAELAGILVQGPERLPGGWQAEHRRFDCGHGVLSGLPEHVVVVGGAGQYVGAAFPHGSRHPVLVDGKAVEAVLEAQPPPASGVNRRRVGGRGDILHVVQNAPDIREGLSAGAGSGQFAHLPVEVFVKPRVDHPQDVTVAHAAAIVVVPASHAHEDVGLRLPGVGSRDHAHLQGVDRGDDAACQAAVELLGSQEGELLVNGRLIGGGRRSQRQGETGQSQAGDGSANGPSAAATGPSVRAAEWFGTGAAKSSVRLVRRVRWRLWPHRTVDGQPAPSSKIMLGPLTLCGRPNIHIEIHQ